MWKKFPRDILVIPNYVTYLGLQFINSWNFFWTVFYTVIQFRLIKNYSQWLPCFNSSLFPLHTKLHTRNIHRPITRQILKFTKNQFLWPYICLEFSLSFLICVHLQFRFYNVWAHATARRMSWSFIVIRWRHCDFDGSRNSWICIKPMTKFTE